MTSDDLGKIVRLVGTGIAGRISAYMKDEDGLEEWSVRYLDANGVKRVAWFRKDEVELKD